MTSLENNKKLHTSKWQRQETNFDKNALISPEGALHFFKILILSRQFPIRMKMIVFPPLNKRKQRKQRREKEMYVGENEENDKPIDRDEPFKSEAKENS